MGILNWVTPLSTLRWWALAVVALGTAFGIVALLIDKRSRPCARLAMFCGVAGFVCLTAIERLYPYPEMVRQVLVTSTAILPIALALVAFKRKK